MPPIWSRRNASVFYSVDTFLRTGRNIRRVHKDQITDAHTKRRFRYRRLGPDRRVCRADAVCAVGLRHDAGSATTRRYPVGRAYFFGSVIDQGTRIRVRKAFGFYTSESLLRGDVDGPARYGIESDPVRPTRRRPRYICGIRETRTLLDRTDRLCRHGRLVDRGFADLQQPGRIFTRDLVGCDDADSSSRAVGHDAARSKAKNYRRVNTIDLFAMLRSDTFAGHLSLVCRLCD